MSEINQHAAILKMLRKAGNKGVENHKFVSHRILRYGARITELRQEGYNIYCERLVLRNGRKSNTFVYYLTEE